MVFRCKSLILQPSSVNWNWDILDRDCESLLEKSSRSEKSFKPIAFAGTREWSLLHDTVPWIWSANNNITEAVSFTVHLFQVYGNKKDIRLSREEIEGNFLRGQYAMIVSGYWLIGRATDYKFLAGNITPADIGVLPIPAQTGKKAYTFVGGSNLVLFDKPRRTKEATQIARDFIRFLLDTNQQVFYSQKARVLPARKNALDEISKNFPHVKASLKLLESGRSYPARADWADIEFRLVRNLTLVWDFASGLYTDVKDPKNDKHAEKTISEILAIADPYWAYITK